MNRRPNVAIALLVAAAFWFVACGTPTAVPLAQSNTGAARLYIPIVNQDMTHDEIARAIQAEGAVVAASWPYTAGDAIVKQFQDWVKQEYGVDVKLEYAAAPSPAIYLTNLYTAQKAGNPSPYDVMAIEENYFFDAKSNGAVQAIYPSGLIPNWERVEPQLRHDPHAVGFQSTSTPAPIFHADKIGSWFQDWKDLADPRLKGRITMPWSGDATAGGFMIGMAWSLGKEYHDETQMTETIDFICTRVHPNVLKYTTDAAEMQQLLRAGVIDAASFWNSLGRLEALSGADGTQDTVYRPMKSGQPADNGFLWIPKDARHPMLAQLFINWRLSDDGQFPGETWNIPHNAWAEYHEGLLGASYIKNIPAWLTDDYYKYYPKLEDVKQFYRPIDWDYYARHSDSWYKQYSKCAG